MFVLILGILFQRVVEKYVFPSIFKTTEIKNMKNLGIVRFYFKLAEKLYIHSFC